MRREKFIQQQIADNMPKPAPGNDACQPYTGAADAGLGHTFTSPAEVIADKNLRAAEALAQAAETKRKRTILKIGARPVAALVALSISGFGLHSCADDIIDKFDKFKTGVVHDDTQVTPHYALTRVSLPNKSIVVEGEGTGGVVVQTRKESDIWGAGDIYNAVIAPFTDKKTIVGQKGKAQIITERNAITLRPYELPEKGKDGEKKYGVIADVDIDRLDAQDVMKADRHPNGDVKVDTKDDRVARIFNTDDDYAKRGVKVADAAAVGFLNECGKLLKHLLPAGVIVHVRDELISASKLLKATSRREAKVAADMLQDMSQAKIVVNLMKKITRGGVPGTRKASASEIRFPTQNHYSRAGLAKDLGVKPENLHVAPTGECTPTGPAVQQYYKLLNESKGIDTTDLGV